MPRPETRRTDIGRTAALWRIVVVVWLFVSMVVSIFLGLRRARGLRPEDRDEIYRIQAQRFRETAEQLGGLLIKVGQFLSSRVDLLPRTFVDEIASLQDHVHPAPWEAIAETLQEELGARFDTFSSFDRTPLAAASLGQVYRARLPDGTEVAVKVRRPQIESIVEADLRALGLIVRLTSFTRFGRTFDLSTVLREFRQVVAEELDYLHEAENTERIRAVLTGFPFVRVPHTLPLWSTGRVLTMEYWAGVKISEVEAIRRRGIDPSMLAARIIHLYLHMVMDAGVYHADPHPGNLLVTDSGEIVLLDYGMVGTLEIGLKRQLRKLFVGISEQDPQALMESLEAIGMVLPRADRVALRQRLRYMLDRYYAETLTQLAELDVTHLLRDFETILQDEGIQVPGELAFLGRAIAILVGLATQLDPDVNLIRLFAPYAHRFVTEDQGGSAGYVLGKAQGLARDVLQLPRLSARTLRRIDEGELETGLRWREGQRELRRIGRAIERLTRALYQLGFLLLAVLLFGQHRPHLAWGAVVLAAITFVVGLAGRRS